MHRIDDQQGFLLHKRNFQNTSLILEVLTRDYGIISIVAKGALRKKNKADYQSARLLTLGWSGKQELKTLTTIESISYLIPPECHLSLMYINELVLKLLPRKEPIAGIFSAYHDVIYQLNIPELEARLRKFEIQLLMTAGLMPDLDKLNETGESLQSDNRYQVIPDRGVIDADNNNAEAYLGNHLQSIAKMEFGSKEVLRTAKFLMRSLINFQLKGVELQSRRLVHQMYRKSK